MKKIIKVLLIILICSLFFGTISYANTMSDIFPGGVSMQPPAGGLDQSANKILSIIQWVAYAIAIGMLIMVGVKYTMTAADQRADLKTSAIKYVVGAIIIGGASGLMGMIYKLASSVK